MLQVLIQLSQIWFTRGHVRTSSVVGNESYLQELCDTLGEVLVALDVQLQLVESGRQCRRSSTLVAAGEKPNQDNCTENYFLYGQTLFCQEKFHFFYLYTQNHSNGSHNNQVNQRTAGCLCMILGPIQKPNLHLHWTKPYKNTCYLTCTINMTTRHPSPSRLLNKRLLNLMSPLTGTTCDSSVTQAQTEWLFKKCP